MHYTILHFRNDENHNEHSSELEEGERKGSTPDVSDKGRSRKERDDNVSFLKNSLSIFIKFTQNFPQIYSKISRNLPKIF